MPIDKSVNPAPLTVEIEQSDSAQLPDIEIILEDDGSAVIEIGEDQDVGFYGNLAEVVDEGELAHISIELMAMFEADKSGRGVWEQM